MVLGILISWWLHNITINDNDVPLKTIDLIAEPANDA